MYWQKITRSVSSQVRLLLLHRRLQTLKHKRAHNRRSQTLPRHHNPPIVETHTRVTTAATTDLSVAAGQASAARGTGEVDSVSAIMTAPAGARVQALAHGVTGTVAFMIGDLASVDHGTAAEAVVLVSAAMTAPAGIPAHDTTEDLATDLGMIEAVAIMIGDQTSVDHGIMATVAEWASAGNYPASACTDKSPALQGFFDWLD